MPQKQESRALELMPLRHKLTLAYTMLAKPETKWPNLDLSPARITPGTSNSLPTLLPTHQIYSIEHRRYLTGLESLQHHGFPTFNEEQRRRLDELEVSDVQLKDLAGNSFVAPCYMAVLLGLITNFPLQVLQDRVTQKKDKKMAAKKIKMNTNKEEMDKADEFIDDMMR